MIENAVSGVCLSFLSFPSEGQGLKSAEQLKRSLKKSQLIYTWEYDYIQFGSGQVNHDAN